MPPASPPELSRLVPLARVDGQGLVVDVRADADECRRIAARLRIPGVSSLEVGFSLQRLQTTIVQASGRLQAAVTQECVVSLETFETSIVETFSVRFVPSEAVSEDMIDPDDVDEIGYDGDQIDHGQAAVEQLALALDPFPRKPGVTLPPHIAGGEDQPAAGATIHPFARLRSRGSA